MAAITAAGGCLASRTGLRRTPRVQVSMGHLKDSELVAVQEKANNSYIRRRLEGFGLERMNY